MASQTPLTELDAINLMLSVIGEAPINVLSDEPQTVDVSLAQKQLGNTLNEVQSKGYNFNREYNITLLPDGNGNINVPTNYTRVQIDEAHGDTSMDIVHRGTRLYDRKNRTYVFTKNVVVRCIVLLPFDQIPECARRYISIKAARAFADRVMGDQATHAFTAMEEAQAKILLDNEEGENVGHTIFDNWSVGRTLQRTSHTLPVGFV
jgi:hypothetical protein